MSREELEALNAQRCYNTNDYLQPDGTDPRPKAKEPWAVVTPVNKGNSMSCSTHLEKCPDDCDTSDKLMKEVCKSDPVFGLMVAAEKLKKSQLGNLKTTKVDIDKDLPSMSELEEETEKALNTRSFHIPRPVLEDPTRATMTATTRAFSKLRPPEASVTPFNTEILEVPGIENQRQDIDKQNKAQVEHVRKAMQRNAERHRVTNPYDKNNR